MSPGPYSPVVSPTLDDPHAVHRINLSWLVRLRWGAIIGQVAVISYARWGIGMELPMAELLAILGVEGAANVAVSAWLARSPAVPEAAVAGSLALDVSCFTGLLYLTGGPMNPFSFLYLVHIALAALVLRQRWTWLLVLLSAAGNGALFLRHVPLPMEASAGEHAHHAMHHGAHGGEPFAMHLKGMWVAFAVAAAFIVYFIHRVTRALREREAELARARELGARTEKLASMATLAAGAAHELGTPLATIAVAARELERAVRLPEVAADARLIREQVDRCTDILRQMAGGAGEPPGEGITETSVGDLVKIALAGLPSPERVLPEWQAGTREGRVGIPVRATAQALRNVLKNGIDASPEDRDVALRISRGSGGFLFEVLDLGTGMSPDVLARAAEPFFTTKDPGKGMGLGLFLTRSVVELLGGSLAIDSEPGKGTRVVVSLPEMGRDKGSHRPLTKDVPQVRA